MPVNTIQLEEIQSLLRSGQPLHILDVRTPAEFSRIHVQGARLVPLDKLDANSIAAQRHDENEPIYMICQSGSRSAKACSRLQKVGVQEIYSIEGGTVGWERAGLPVERSGSKVISLERQVRIGAGALVLVGLILAWTVHPAFIFIDALVGTGLVFAGVTDYCGMALVLGKMPWNQCASPPAN